MATGEGDLRGLDVSDGDRLPWLESATDDREEGPSGLRIALLVLIGLAVIAAIIWGLLAWQNRGDEGGGTGGLIAAQEGDYKVKPDEPGGTDFKGEGTTALETSEGGVLGNSSIDLGSVTETPVAGRRARPGPAPVVAGGAVAIPPSGGQLKAAPTTATRAVASTGGGGSLVQLGSFPSEAAANGQWTTLSKRFGYLAPLGKSVERAEVNGATVFRLRVNAGGAGAANELCGKLKVAGEACFIPR